MKKAVIAIVMAVVVMCLFSCNSEKKRPMVSTGGYTWYPESKCVQCNGKIEYSGGETVTERGICYTRSTAAPSLSDAHVSAGSGKGAFSAIIQNVQPGKYHYSAYATNSAGTSYGSIGTFVISEP